MKQILQNLKDGSTELAEVPCPRLAPGHLLLRTTRTLISAGTERMLVDFGKANPLEKARQQPDKVRQLLAGVTGPKALVMTVNAGAIPADHWTQDPAVGGGRIIGETCHFIDLLRFLAGAPIVRAEALALDTATRDSVSITLGFADGSLGTILYLANGSKAFPKERLEVFAAGRVLQLDNFRKLTGFGWPGFKKLNLWCQDKGQQACAAAFVQALRARVAGEAVAPPIPLAEILEVSRVTIEVATGI